MSEATVATEKAPASHATTNPRYYRVLVEFPTAGWRPVVEVHKTRSGALDHAHQMRAEYKSGAYSKTRRKEWVATSFTRDGATHETQMWSLGKDYVMYLDECDMLE